MTLSHSGQRIFVDASAFYATIDRGDSRHTEAATIQRNLARGRYVLLTSNFVLAETHALLLNRLGRDIALRFLSFIDEAGYDVVRASSDDEAAAVTLIRQHQDKSYSYVDALSFVIMQRMGIRRAFTFDHHFEQFGLEILTPDR